MTAARRKKKASNPRTTHRPKPQARWTFRVDEALTVTFTLPPEIAKRIAGMKNQTEARRVVEHTAMLYTKMTANGYWPRLLRMREPL